jgi:hypothetical protein
MRCPFAGGETRRLRLGDHGNIALHLDPAPAWQHQGQPGSRFFSLRGFLRGQLHTQQLVLCARVFPLPLPSALLQMASQRAQAQTSTAAECILPHAAAGNSDTNCWTSARVRRPRRTAFGSPFILPVQHWTCALARCVGQTLTVVSFQTEEWLRCGPDRSCLLKIADRHAKARLAHGVCGRPGHCGPT